MTQETDTGTTTEVEIEVETETGIEETAEIIVEIEEDQIQEKVETTNRDWFKKDFSDYCNRTGHPTHRCFKLENYLKRQGKRIVLHDDDDV